MPLPAALQARLAKRGLVEEQPEVKVPSKTGPDEEEEVFAEDYDDPSKPDNQVIPTKEPVHPVVPPTQPQEPLVDIVGEGPIFFETTACPNRQNPYHECLTFCRKHYGMREWDPDDDMIKKRERMLRKYPLLSGWVEVGDYDTGRYYYWNVHSDEVSWLSPTHPKAQITHSAESLGLVGKIGDLESDDEEKEEAMDTTPQTLNVNVDSDTGSDTSLSDEEDFIDKRGRVKNRGKLMESKRGPGRKRDDLDPMDPAAYSDIPRGGWSEGLDMRGKAKTGVDTTASGPLFQQRPYPSPGDILRANQSVKKKK